MSTPAQPITIVIDGITINAGMHPPEGLARAVIVSLFTWRRALPGDVAPGEAMQGWWGDTTAEQAGDRIGSRLWLLIREKLTARTVARAEEYAREALQWLVDDGVASRVEVEAQRIGLDRLGLACRIWRADGIRLDLRFDNLWEEIARV